MAGRNLTRSRFDAQEEEPLGPAANLVDIVLVFACGLIAALIAHSGDLRETFERGGEEVVQGREIAELPTGVGRSGSGYQAVGRVYRDPQTGRLIMVGDKK